MARLNISNGDDSDDELPDLMTILRGDSGTCLGKASRGAAEAAAFGTGKMPKSDVVASRSIKSVSGRTTSAPSKEEQSRKQRPHQSLKLTHVNSLLLPLSQRSFSGVKKPLQDGDHERQAQRVRSTPKRAASKPVDYSIFSPKRADRSPFAAEDDESSTDLSGFIVPDSASEEEDRLRKPRRREIGKRFRKISQSDQAYHQDQTGNSQRTERSRKPSEIIDLSSPDKKPSNTQLPHSPLSLALPDKNQHLSAEPFNLDEPFSQIRFSPPRSRNPPRIKDFECSVTPPSSPTKPNLESPLRKSRIPPSPHRPSIDAFWSQDVTNDWNDQYSPRKAPRTPRQKMLLTLDEYDEVDSSPSASPRKGPTKSPTKKDEQAAKAFNAEKSSLATTFLAELDDKITNSQVSNLAASTGGISIIWSKKLSSTAGRANWRREAIRHKIADGTYPETTYRHHASIELAEKVIDCEDRLTNVLAHEYCHLANFMISGVKDQPHGKEFKAWAAKVTRAFRHRGVEVTTKHGYDISYKYVWSCGECGLKYKRHSKSIDPSKHSCGTCKGKLSQVLPAPGKESEYHKFVKANWDRFKRQAGEGAGIGEINGLLAKDWKVKKAGEGKGKEMFEVAEVADDGDGETEESPELDNVARKLGFLNLRN